MACVIAYHRSIVIRVNVKTDRCVANTVRKPATLHPMPASEQHDWLICIIIEMSNKRPVRLVCIRIDLITGKGLNQILQETTPEQTLIRKLLISPFQNDLNSLFYLHYIEHNLHNIGHNLHSSADNKSIHVTQAALMSPPLPHRGNDYINYYKTCWYAIIIIDWWFYCLCDRCADWFDCAHISAQMRRISYFSTFFTQSQKCPKQEFCYRRTK